MLSKCLRVLRPAGKQVELETEWVLAQIDLALDSPSSSPSSPGPWYVAKFNKKL